MDLELASSHLVLAGAALLLLGVVGALVAERIRVPGLLLFLGVGMLIGDDGLGWISLSDAGLTQDAAVLALVLILYDGGLSTPAAQLRAAVVPALSLATVGVVVTGLVAAGAAALVFDVSGTTAMLIGVVVASTDAAAVFAVLRGIGLPRRLSRVLEVESGANDPMAVLLTVGLLAGWRDHVTGADWVVFGIRQLGGGLSVGLLIGLAGAAVLVRVRVVSVALYPVLGLGVGGLAYGAAAALGMSGFLAVYVAGMMVATRAPSRRRAVRTFLEVLASTAQIGLFLLLGLLVFPSRLADHALPALVVALVLVLVARPVAVVLSVGWMRFGAREVVLLSWAGLRGAVPIVLATFPLTEGYPDGDLIFEVVFFVVLVSVLVQGLTVAGLVRRLGLGGEVDPVASIAEAVPLDVPGVEVMEIELGTTSALVGEQLARVPPPGGARIAVILRDGDVVIPTGETALEVGDHIVVFGPAHPNLAHDVGTWVDAGSGPALPAT